MVQGSGNNGNQSTAHTISEARRVAAAESHSIAAHKPFVIVLASHFLLSFLLLCLSVLLLFARLAGCEVLNPAIQQYKISLNGDVSKHGPFDQ